MRISYIDEELRNLCLDADYAVLKLGPKLANELKLIIASIASAQTFSDLPGEDYTILANKPFSLNQIGMAGNLQLICKAHHTKIFPKTKIGDINWSQVNYIQITQIKTGNG